MDLPGVQVDRTTHAQGGNGIFQLPKASFPDRGDFWRAGRRLGPGTFSPRRSTLKTIHLLHRLEKRQGSLRLQKDEALSRQRPLVEGERSLGCGNEALPVCMLRELVDTCQFGDEIRADRVMSESLQSLLAKDIGVEAFALPNSFLHEES